MVVLPHLQVHPRSQYGQVPVIVTSRAAAEHGRRFYATDPELRRLFKSVNGLIFPGGLTDLYIDDPYVIAAKKLHSWAAEANDAGEVSILQHDIQRCEGGPSAAVMRRCFYKLHALYPYLGFGQNAALYWRR